MSDETNDGRARELVEQWRPAFDGGVNIVKADELAVKIAAALAEAERRGAIAGMATSAHPAAVRAVEECAKLCDDRATRLRKLAEGDATTLDRDALRRFAEEAARCAETIRLNSANLAKGTA